MRLPALRWYGQPTYRRDGPCADTGQVTAPARSRALLTTAFLGTAIVAGCVLFLVLRGRPLDVLYGLWIVLNGPAGVLSLWIALLVQRQFPRHVAGRVLLVLGVLSVLHVLVATVVDQRLVAAGHRTSLVGDHGLVPTDLPLGASVPLLLMNVLWVPVAILATLLLAYFPDGELPGPRWRWVPATAVAATVLLMAATAVDAWPTSDWSDLAGAPSLLAPLFWVGGLAAAAVVAGGVAAFVRRWWTSGRERRRFEVVGAVLVIAAVLGVLTYPWPRIWMPLVHVGFAVFLLAYGAAISRYRLHDIEPVLGKGAVVTAVSALAVAAYLGIVVGLGHLVGARTGDPVLALVAVAVTALLVAPTGTLVRRGVDRVLYGDRGQPTDVLTALVDHRPGLDGATSTDIAEMVRRATGATCVEIELEGRDGPPLSVSAGGPDGGAPLVRSPVGDEGGGGGEIRIHARARADLAPGATELAADVGRIMSLLLLNERLTRDLARELEHSRASRLRLVEAQEKARRELERDVHDGAQARLIAVTMHVGELRRRVAAGSVEDPAGELGRIDREVHAAIRELRDLSRGLHPPVLEQLGLAAAVRAHLRDAALPVAVVDSGTARYPQALEGAGYFACIEAVQNALRHGGSSISVDLECAPTRLRLAVTDDGGGFDPAGVSWTGLEGIRDRVGALGGVVEVHSRPGAGTRVEATIPVPDDAAQVSAAAR